MKKIAIIGAGFTGLSAAMELVDSGHLVDVIELDDKPGGLANGFSDNDWLWSLEKHYHHIFTSDKSIINIAKKSNHEITFLEPKTYTFFKKDSYFQLDSPQSLLKFSPINIFERLRMGFSLALMKFNPIWKLFEYFTAEKYLVSTMGTNVYNLLWRPLLIGKFGKYANLISAAWFWSRIYKRSKKLGYPVGGFESLALSVENTLKQKGVNFFYNSKVQKIINEDKTQILEIQNQKSKKYDYVICTLPNHLFSQIATGLTKEYISKLNSFNGLGAVNLVLSLSNKFLPNNIYWMNINAQKYPFLSIVEHTNFIDSKYYGHDTIIYIGNYLDPAHKYFTYNESQLVNEFMPYLKQINPNINHNWIKKSWVWKAKFAQPIVTTNYSQKILPFNTPIPGIYLANIQQVYPWDRGVNYAVELGQKVSYEILSDI